MHSRLTLALFLLFLCMAAAVAGGGAEQPYLGAGLTLLQALPIVFLVQGRAADARRFRWSEQVLGRWAPVCQALLCLGVAAVQIRWLDDAYWPAYVLSLLGGCVSVAVGAGWALAVIAVGAACLLAAFAGMAIYVGWGVAMPLLAAAAAASVLAILAVLMSRGGEFTAWRFSRFDSNNELATALGLRNRMLREAHEVKARALNVASHEIRQPIHAIGLLIERMRVDASSPALREQIDAVSDIVHSVSDALELLLDIARLDSGTVRISRSRFDLADLLRKVAREHEAAAVQKGLKLQVSDSDDLPVYTDRVHLQRILSNLLANAIRYTDRGEVRISCTRPNADLVAVHVADTGSGIPQDSLDKIFNDFYRVDRENQSAQGFGLGLAIVRRTALLLGLDVSVKSELGFGSTFTVTLPRAAETEKSADQPKASTVKPSTASRSLVGCTGLLIENDTVALKAMEAMIRAWGGRPLVATGERELFAKLAHHEDKRFDFVIADYHLGSGQRNGLELIQAVRELAKGRVPAALLTGDLNVRVANEAAEDIRILHKPVTPARLKAAVDEMVRAKSRTVAETA